jgi:hypothetical protein
MRQQSKEYIIILFIVSVLALNYPFLDMFDRPWTPFGIPLLYFYLYLVWFLIIVLLIVVVEHSEIHEPGEPVQSASALENPSPLGTESAAKARGADPAESP